MKKIVGIIISFYTGLVFSSTCPPADMLLLKVDNGNFEIAPPQGWSLHLDTRPTHDKKPNLVFRLAAWGDYQTATDRVKCHYYDENDAHILLDSVQFYTENNIHFDEGAKGYRLCLNRNNDVTACQFGE